MANRKGGLFSTLLIVLVVALGIAGGLYALHAWQRQIASAKPKPSSGTTDKTSAEKPVQAPTLPTAKTWASEAEPDPDSKGAFRLVRHIPRLPYPRKTRLPLLNWGGSPKEGAPLQHWIDRGISPFFNGTRHQGGAKKAIPKLRYLQENGVPVVVLPQGQTQLMFIPSRKRGWPPGADHKPPARPEEVDGDFTCPAWLWENPHLEKHGRKFEAVCRLWKDEGIEIAAVVIDYETGPYLRNGAEREDRVRKAMEEAWKCPRCLERFGKEKMDTPAEYAALVDAGRAHVVKVTLSDPVHAVFPEARTGNFYAWPINRLPPEEGMYPAYGYDNAGMTIAMPRKYFTAGWAGSGRDEEKAAWICLREGLKAFTPCAKVLRPDEWLIPWVGHVSSRDAVREKKGHAYPPPRGYAELVRHMMLRGAETFALFNPHSLTAEFPEAYGDIPRKEVGPWIMLVEGVQRGYAQMLRFEDFLRRAKPLTFQTPSEVDDGVWSGMAADGVALIRTVTWGAEGEKDVALFDMTVRVPFARTGRFYWVFSDGRLEAVEDDAAWEERK